MFSFVNLSPTVTMKGLLPIPKVHVPSCLLKSTFFLFWTKGCFMLVDGPRRGRLVGLDNRFLLPVWLMIDLEWFFVRPRRIGLCPFLFFFFFFAQEVYVHWLFVIISSRILFFSFNLENKNKKKKKEKKKIAKRKKEKKWNFKKK